MTLAHKSPIVNSIVFNLIRQVHYEKFKRSKKYFIDTSIIPKISEDYIFKKGFKESGVNKNKESLHLLIPRRSILEKTKNIKIKENLTGEKKDISPTTEFKESLLDQKNSASEKGADFPSQNKNIPIISQKKVLTSVPINLLINPPNYGKLDRLMKDRRISVIECDGPEKPLKVVCQDKEQIVNVFLTKKEIKNLLYQISAKTRIPLIEEGVYRVSWDDFIINSVISDKTDPSFVIKRVNFSFSPISYEKSPNLKSSLLNKKEIYLQNNSLPRKGLASAS